MNYLDYSVFGLESSGLRRRPVFHVSDVQSLPCPFRRQSEPETVEVRPQSQPTESKSGRFRPPISSSSTCHAMNWTMHSRSAARNYLLTLLKTYFDVNKVISNLK